MTYYPKSHIKTGLFTRGKEWMLENGVEYKGSYYSTFDGKTFTRPKPSKNSQRLIPYSELRQDNPVIMFYDTLPKDTNVRGISFPRPIFPNLDPQDYKNGSITRYFTKKTNDINDPIREIDKKEYDRINENLSAFYYTINLQWKISGLKYDAVVNDTMQSGIVDTNRRTLYRKEQQMPGIIQRLPNLLQFSNYNEIANI